jgi:ubiquinone/menaquinone biosynthesis C-methylase UbiE
VIARSFDLLAPHYRWMEFVLAGGKLQGCRTMFLDEFARANNVLLLGEGNGRFLTELLRRNSTVNVTCVDASAAMQRTARSRLARKGFGTRRVAFVHSDVLACEFPASAFDAIAANFFLDCFPPEELERVVHRMSEWAAPEARLIVSDFQRPENGIKRWRANAILAVMYLFFRIATGLPARRLTAPEGFLKRSGFHLAKRNEREWGLLYSELWRKKDH